MNCMYCVPKGTCPVEALLNNEKIKPVALSIIELCLSESISQSVSRKLHVLSFSVTTC